MPALKPLRRDRSALQLVCVARLVEKKGLDHQLRIYAALQAAGVPVKLSRYEGMIHGFVRRFPFFEQGRKAIDEVARELRRSLTG